ncbi:MAG TPA: hypothetical protein VE570_13170 [Thermoleophilaceae bacterium]|nr:hypothetical protein [Thermoleophilaceae bacterium]
MNEDLDRRLRENRYEPTGLELDELKRRATAQASRGARSRQRRSPRLVTSFLALALVLSGGSAVVASTSGTSSGGQPSASVSQYEQIIAGERVVPGSARLLAPTGCVSKAFNARVRGVNVQKVVFKLDGKTIKTLTKPNRGSLFNVRINPAKMKIGVHRIVATVTFKPATKKKAQTFRISFQRCAKKLAAPRFTG